MPLLESNWRFSMEELLEWLEAGTDRVGRVDDERIARQTRKWAWGALGVTGGIGHDRDAVALRRMEEPNGIDVRHGVSLHVRGSVVVEVFFVVVCVFVVVETDEGLTGLGDATLNGRELAVASYLADHVIPCLIGRDPHRIEDIWQYLYKGAYWRRGPVTMTAIAAVDTAEAIAAIVPRAMPANE